MTEDAEPLRINGRVVEPGTELSVRGESGRFVYRWRTGEDLTCWGGRLGHERYRSFRPEQVRTVHTRSVLRPPRGV